MSIFRELIVSVRASVRTASVVGIAAILAASCQGQIGRDVVGSGGKGGALLGGSGGISQGLGGRAGTGGGAGDGPSGAAGSSSGGTSGAAGSGGGGTSGAAGAGGSVATNDGGVQDRGSDVTFTALYATVFGPLCAGTLCHNPGIQKGMDFSSQAKAYASLTFEVVPGDSAGSALSRLLADGTMPPDPPKLTTDQLAAVRAWIDAGALNN